MRPPWSTTWPGGWPASGTSLTEAVGAVRGRAPAVPRRADRAGSTQPGQSRKGRRAATNRATASVRLVPPPANRARSSTSAAASTAAGRARPRHPPHGRPGLDQPASVARDARARRCPRPGPRRSICRCRTRAPMARASESGLAPRLARGRRECATSCSIDRLSSDVGRQVRLDAAVGRRGGIRSTPTSRLAGPRRWKWPPAREACESADGPGVRGGRRTPRPVDTRMETPKYPVISE